MKPEDRLEETFKLVMSDLYEANAAAQVSIGFMNYHNQLAKEPADRQEVWAFIDQAIIWKLALAVERLIQNAGSDRASFKGLIKEIKSAQKNGFKIIEINQIEAAQTKLENVLKSDICNKLKVARNAFIGHSLIGESRRGAPVYDVIELIGELESIAESFHVGVFGVNCPDLDTHIDNWRQLVSSWFETFLPDQDNSTN